MPWNAKQAYSYCDTAVSQMMLDRANGVLTCQVSPAQADAVLNGGDASSKVKDQSFGNQMSQFWRLGGSYTGTFQTLIGSALTMSKRIFNSQSSNTKYSSIETRFYIHDTETISQSDCDVQYKVDFI